MAVSFKTVAIATDTGTSILINKPTGTVENDLLICAIATDGNAVITTLSGWTLIQGGGVNPVDDTPAHGVYYKKATDSEPDNYTWQLDSSEAICSAILRYDGQDLTNPINVSGHAESTGSTTPQAPDVETTIDGCMIIRLAAGDKANFSRQVPSGTNERVNHFTVGTTGNSQMVADHIQTTMGLTGTADFSQGDAEEWYCFTVAIAPATAAGWTGKINGVTNPAKIMGIAVANISKVMGVN